MKPVWSARWVRSTSKMLQGLAIMVLPLAGCRDNPTAPALGEDAALIRPAMSSVPLFWVVGEARAGQPFDVEINTFGLTSCWSKVRTEVTPGPLVVITAYNRAVEPPPGSGCYQMISRIEHVVTLSYPTPGEKQLIIRGRSFDTRAPIEFPVTLVVKP